MPPVDMESPRQPEGAGERRTNPFKKETLVLGWIIQNVALSICFGILGWQASDLDQELALYVVQIKFEPLLSELQGPGR